MSLNTDTSRCPQYPSAQELREKWETIVAYLCMFCGVQEITPKNVEKMRERIAFWEHCAGPLAGDLHGPVPADVIDVFIGLRTNVSPMNDAAFLKRAFEVYRTTTARRKAA